MGLWVKIFGDKKKKILKPYWEKVFLINKLESKISILTNSQLISRLNVIKYKIRNIVVNKSNYSKKNINFFNEITNPYIYEVFAIVRETAKRVLNMRHFDVQILGGLLLHSGKIIEMKTGEGKTLVATLPAVLNSLLGLGVHIITTNDYLASRDEKWMGKIYNFLNITTSTLSSNMELSNRIKAYNSDITYGQNNEFGFDYLRDNMQFFSRNCVQKNHFFAIVDEVDSILIDEARTPLIISGLNYKISDKYKFVNNIISFLVESKDFIIDRKLKTISLTELGIQSCEKLLKIKNLYQKINTEWPHYINQSLRAHKLFHRDMDYVVERGQIVIVDEHTGRLMHSRRWSEGLHQAIEAKENINIKPESQTLARITFQNYFRMYKKLSGMTGTAETEALELHEIYNVDVTVIPTNKPMIKKDEADKIYKSEKAKTKGIIKDIINCYNRKQPILVGTTSIEQSEQLSLILNKLFILHNVLNAKFHNFEASIIAQAGKLNQITIATNIAGRGTDIILGGNSDFISRFKIKMKYDYFLFSNKEYFFLSGNPKLILIDKLINMDLNNIKYIIIIIYKLINVELSKNKSIKVQQVINLLLNVEKRKYFKKIIYNYLNNFYNKIIITYNYILKKNKIICNNNKKQVIIKGGLRVIGSTKHESRRIDNQLKGRTGRQGDVGTTCFYVSLEDNLMRTFGSDKIQTFMNNIGFSEETLIVNSLVSKSIESAQKKIEGIHFNYRKQLIEYDNILEIQRNAIYKLRKSILYEKNIEIITLKLLKQFIHNLIEILNITTDINENILKKLNKNINHTLGFIIFKGALNNNIHRYIYKKAIKLYKNNKRINFFSFNEIEKYVYLKLIDQGWKEHLQSMDYLREGIHLRSYAQKDPIQEYKKESHHLFTAMIIRTRDEILKTIFKNTDTSLIYQRESINILQKELNKISIFKKSNENNILNNNMLITNEDISQNSNRKNRRFLKSQQRKNK